MKKQLTFLIMTLLFVNVLAGCADQARAPHIEAEDTETATLTITEEPATDPDFAGQPATEQATEQEITIEATESFDQLAMPVAGDKIAIMETDMGTIRFKLFTELAPEMSKNFQELASAGSYNDVPFHRVMKDFMIQTGDFTNKNGMGGHSYKGPNTTLDDEITPALKHLYGTVSMANRGPNTNGSQFFIVTNTDGTPFLDGGYSVFGQVYEGMDVALSIAELQTPGAETPSRQVNMTKVKVLNFE